MIQRTGERWVSARRFPDWRQRQGLTTSVVGRSLATSILVASLTVIPLLSQDVKPVARIGIDGPSRVTVGEPVKLIAEILVPTWFTGAPRFPELDIPGAVVLFQETAGFTERIGSDSFAGQRREYLIYPYEPRSYRISDFSVVTMYATSARPSPPTEVTYVFQRPGTIVLPAVELYWWDSGGRQIREARVDAFPLTVVEALAEAEIAVPAEFPGEEDQNAAEMGPRTWVILSSLVLLAGLGWLLRSLLKRRTADSASAMRRKDYFLDFKTEALAGNARRAFGSLLSWLDHTDDPAGEAYEPLRLN